MEWIICLGIGALTGLIAGLLGAGGGWIAVPALTLGLPYAGVGGPDLIKIAIASTHAINFFTSISAARAYIEKGSVHWPALFRMLPGTVIGVTGGAMIAAAVNVKAVTAVFVMAAMYMAFRMIRGERVAAAFEPLAGALNLSAKGLAVGGLVGIVGGGGLSVPLLLRYMPVRTAIGTAAALSVPIAVIAVLSYAFAASPAGCPSGCLGFIYLPAVCAAGVAAVMMAPVGSFLAHAMPIVTLKRVFAAVLVLVALNLSRKIIPERASVAENMQFAFASIIPRPDICALRVKLQPVHHPASLSR
jgi:uncharacterized membrane protein YfcA